MAPPSRVLTPSTDSKEIRKIKQRLDAMDTADDLGSAATKGTTIWQDSTGTNRIIVGVQSDGSVAIWVVTASGTIQIIATGAGAGNISAPGVVIALGGLNTGDRNFKFVKTSSTRLDITTS